MIEGGDERNSSRSPLPGYMMAFGTSPIKIQEYLFKPFYLWQSFISRHATTALKPNC